MSIAKVIYNITNDSDFAEKWGRDPEGALAGKGLKLGREELVFLKEGLRRGRQGGSVVRLSEIALKATSWM
jgi:hypothetical protein